MKKLVLALSIILVLTSLSVFAADIDDNIVKDPAPLAAAKFASAQNKDADTYGTINLEIVTSILDGYAEFCTVESSTIRNKYTVPNSVFDVVATFDFVGEFAGYTIRTFFNPERIVALPTEDASAYQLAYEKSTGKPGYIAAAPSIGRAAHITDSKAVYMAYLENLGTDAVKAQDYLDAYTNSLKDGSVTAVVSNGDNWSEMDFDPGVEIARWIFKETNESDNNWYRTKLYIDYENGHIASTTANCYPAVSAPVYYYNNGYTGPHFDIVGAMKRNAGEIRFGSVFFKNDVNFWEKGEVLEAGIVCYPTALLGNDILTLETEGALKIAATGYLTETEDELVYTGVLKGLSSAPDMYITAKSYVTYKVGDETITVYSDPIARSLDMVDGYTEMK